MSATSPYYRPPEDLRRTPTYFELFGDISPEEKARNKERIDFLSSRTDLDFYLSPEDLSQLQQDLRSNTYNDELYEEYNKRVEFGETIREVMGEDYDYRTRTFQEAKNKADEVYMQGLQNSLEKAQTPEERKEIQSYIDKGPLVFDNATLKEIRGQYGTFLTDALNAQAMVMGDFLQRNDIDSRAYIDKPYEELREAGRNNIAYLYTGTLAHMIPERTNLSPTGTYDVNFETEDRLLEMGISSSGGTELGQYSMYTALEPKGDSKPWLDPFQTVMDVLSVVYPPLAPVFQGVSNLAETEDLESAVKAGATTYVGGEIIKGVSGEIGSKLSESGIEIPTGEVDAATGATQTTTLGEVFSNLPEPVQNITTNSIGGVLSGQSGEEALTGAIKGELTNVAVDSAIEGLDIDEDKLVANVKETLGLDPDFELPAPIQNIVNDTTDAWVSGDSASDAFTSSAESEVKDYVGGVAEDAVKAGAGIISDALPDVDFETPQFVKDIGDTAVDLLEGPVELIGNVLEPIGEVVEAGADVVQQVTEPVVDLIDEGLDYVGTEYVDPALQAIDDALPHGETPEGPDVDGPDVDVDVELVMPERTPTENLFGDEIGKIYRTPIETYRPAFSQQEIQGMLSQRFRG